MFYLYAFIGMFLQLFVLVLILTAIDHKEDQQPQQACSGH